jgi:hypothetical protein
MLYEIIRPGQTWSYRWFRIREYVRNLLARE